MFSVRAPGLWNYLSEETRAANSASFITSLTKLYLSKTPFIYFIFKSVLLITRRYNQRGFLSCRVVELQTGLRALVGVWVR